MKKIMGIDLIRVNNGAHQMFMENVAKVWLNINRP